MKELLQQYKPFLLFLGKFFLSYLILTVLYQSYLGQFDFKNAEVDGFTKSVARQTEWVLSLFDDQSYSLPHLSEPSVKLFYKSKYIARVVEGCNGLSVMILFVAFVIAFSGKFKNTLLFILIGIAVIHILNVLRIALLCVALYSYPQFENFLHEALFPLVIYGVVFILWVIWVNNYSSYARVSKKK
ncbi:exosortase family protein XrtF [Flavobacterium sp.]